MTSGTIPGASGSSPQCLWPTVGTQTLPQDYHQNTEGLLLEWIIPSIGRKLYLSKAPTIYEL